MILFMSTEEELPTEPDDCFVCAITLVSSILYFYGEEVVFCRLTFSFYASIRLDELSLFYCVIPKAGFKGFFKMTFFFAIC